MNLLQFLALLMLLLMVGCDGRQSALYAAGKGSAQVLTLFGWMVGGALVVWLIVTGLSVYAVCTKRTFHRRWTAALVIGGGAFIPTVVLTILLTYGLRLLPEMNAPAPAGSLTIEISGVRWWWRVRYLIAEEPPIVLANELVLPVGEPVEFKLMSDDVIHSFWIPSLGGKVDMIPGRQTRLKLHPTRAGRYRGTCAEYCGTAHAHMAFDVHVVTRAEFESWCKRQKQMAKTGSLVVDPIVAEGEKLFLQLGCSACHTIRGTQSDGQIGPDLTHCAGRMTIGAGLVNTSHENLKRWIAEPQQLKPGVEMPAFNWLTASEMHALVAYLMHLE